MQIVRDLGGYSLGRSDLVRRAMSKKKQAVMEKERANFIYGNPEEDVPGCVSRGISEQVASGIFDDMTDFAKYAFNKSHAACYAVVAYQTAWLKYYYPVEFMAALMTSVIDNGKKVSEYILSCRNMGIQLLPPDINQGQSGFSVDGKSIRYALTAIKGVGQSAIDDIVAERKAAGEFTNLKDFLGRVADKDVNKRAVENFIKAGALDGLGGSRKQFMSVYVQIMDHITKDRKSNLAGQISLFDIAEESQKEEFDIRLPNVGEYPKEMILAFEKEVLGIYLSGHPLEADQELWQRYITNTTNDFALDEEIGSARVEDQRRVTVGGMIADRSIKYTKNDKVMAFLNLEDLVGNMEIVVFPRDYEKYGSLLVEDARVFIRGRANVEEDKDGKLICEYVVSFEEAAKENGAPLFRDRYGNGGYAGYGQRQGGGPNRPEGGNGQAQRTGSQHGGGRNFAGAAASPDGGDSTGSNAAPVKVPAGVWIQFPDADSYFAREEELLTAIEDSDGNDDVVIFLRDTRAFKLLPANRRVHADRELEQKLGERFGRENVKIRQ